MKPMTNFEEIDTQKIARFWWVSRFVDIWKESERSYGEAEPET
jgi:hypothetical protein